MMNPDLFESIVRVASQIVSTVKEIEEAIERLPLCEQAKVRDWLFRRNAAHPLAKTGAEIVSGWAERAHLVAEEAESFGRDLDALPSPTPKPPRWE